MPAWCTDGLLTASRRGTQRLVQQGGDMWTIQPADLRAFIQAHLERIDIRRVEEFAFVALLTGSDAREAGSGEGG